MGEDIQSIIGSFIKNQRSSKNLSTRALSSLAFGHENYATKILKIEKGVLKGVEFNTLEKIFSGLDISLKNLFLLLDLHKEFPNDFDLGSQMRKILTNTN
jgi:hypothetical protein